MNNPRSKWFITLHPYLQILIGIFIGFIFSILFYLIFNAFNPWEIARDVHSAQQTENLGGVAAFLSFPFKIDFVEAILIDLLLPTLLVIITLRYTSKNFLYSFFLSVLLFLLLFLVTKPAMLEVLLQAYVPDLRRLLFSNFGSRPCIDCSGTARSGY